jgi:putative membrane protein
MQFSTIFKIKKEERVATSFFLLWQITLHIIVIAKYWQLFSVFNAKTYRKVVLNNFHISGFDPLTYLVVSDWKLDFDVTRHPLLAPFYYPLYLINHCIYLSTGINIAPILVSIILLFCSVYAFIFMVRIGKDLIHLHIKEAIMLGYLLFSFAYVMLAAISPDHFIVSLFMILLTLYISGCCIKENRLLKKSITFLLFFFTAGVSLNNGLKTFIANLITNKKAFFRPSNLLFAIILPGIIFLYIGRWQDHKYKDPARIAKRKLEAAQTKREKIKLYAAFKDTTTIKGGKRIDSCFNITWEKYLKQKKKNRDRKPIFAHTGKKMEHFPMRSWTDISTPRIPTLIENFFGQSIQLHQKYALGDVLRDRPIFVKYDWTLNYIIEGAIVLLFLCGIYAGIKQRLLWITLTCFALDVILYLGLGFGINEVYIMASGWIYIIPISVGYLINSLKDKSRLLVTLFISILTLYFIVYNTTVFLINFL